MKPFATLIKPYPSLFMLGKCYMMVLDGRVFKFRVQAYHLKQNSYTVTECGSGDVMAFSEFEQDDFDSITLLECGKCSGRPGSF